MVSLRSQERPCSIVHNHTTYISNFKFLSLESLMGLVSRQVRSMSHGQHFGGSETESKVRQCIVQVGGSRNDLSAYKADVFSDF
jgi:hypothetical protein